MLDRTGEDWLLAMYEMYTDDSGTHAEHPLAIAACYISTKGAWDQFVKEFDDIRFSEGFEEFHMADFSAKLERGVKPFCDWSGEKRERVYLRIAKAINANKRIGLGIAVPKDAFDKVVPSLSEPLRTKCGKNHFAFGVKLLMTMVAKWRSDSQITLPMRYVFDRMGKGKGEIMSIWENIGKQESDFALKKIGLEPNGYSFEDKAKFKPLQAADILAWQMNWHLRNVILAGGDDVRDCHVNFALLRFNQEMHLAFMTEENFLKTMNHEQEVLGRSTT